MRDSFDVIVNGKYIGHVQENDGHKGGFKYTSFRNRARTQPQGDEQEAPSARQAAGRLMLDEIDSIARQIDIKERQIMNLQEEVRIERALAGELRAGIELVKSGKSIDSITRRGRS